MAPSIAPTVLPTHTAPPLTISRCWWVPTVGRHICQISKFIWGQSPLRSNGIRLVLRQIAAICRRRVGPVEGRERHGWRDRGYMDVFTPSPQPDPPRLPTGNQLLPLLRLWLCRCRAASPANPTPLSTACAPALRPAAGCTGTASLREGLATTAQEQADVDLLGTAFRRHQVEHRAVAVDLAQRPRRHDLDPAPAGFHHRLDLALVDQPASSPPSKSTAKRQLKYSRFLPTTPPRPVRLATQCAIGGRAGGSAPQYRR